MSRTVRMAEGDSKGYTHQGYYCTYHRGWCHNPLDCDDVETITLNPGYEVVKTSYLRELEEKVTFDA